MNRCSRLIEEEFINCEAATEPLLLQKGDRMTGFEIIASLPIEEQREVPFALGLFPSPIRESARRQSENIIDAVRILRALNNLYEYNGEGWDEVKE